MRETGPNDPKGLIYEAYRIEGIGPGEARSIFLDWALGLADTQDQAEAAQAMLTRYGSEHPDHPMTVVLREALEPRPGPRRRGGWRSRRSKKADDTPNNG